MERLNQRVVSRAQLDRLLNAAKGGPVLFGRDEGGAIAWMFTGMDRSLLYRLVTEVGMEAAELPTLTPADMRLDEDLPHIMLGPFTRPGRRGCCLPVPGALASALREFLQERDERVPLFMLGELANIEAAFRFDAARAGLDLNRVSLAALRACFCVRSRKRADFVAWGDRAVEASTDASRLRRERRHHARR